MKIDIHTHTKICKSGDAPTRAISAENFCNTILSTDVKIVAITNHNHFDLSQFSEIKTRLGTEAQVWPGIELDILDGETRGHLLVIVSPMSAQEFDAAVVKICGGRTPDSFTAAIDDVLDCFDRLRPLYVAHYKQKKPNLSEETLEKLLVGTQNKRRVLKEVTNSISAGIYISHGHASIYGSDIQDWESYEELSCELPDLRLPVESFEHFCLLSEKDQTTINTALHSKVAEDLVLSPFDDYSTMNFSVFNDINVVFGPKGTGKSCILRAIAEHYTKKGTVAHVYESASDKLDLIFDRKGKNLSINLNEYGINYCLNEISSLRSAAEVSITSLKAYVSHFAAKSTNKNARRILLKNLEPEKENESKRQFIDFNTAAKTTDSFLEFVEDSEIVKEVFNEEERGQLIRVLSELINRLSNREWGKFSGWKEVRLLNSAIKVFRREIERKTGLPAKPTATGFGDYARNRLEVEINASKILASLDTKIPIIRERVGNLGPHKGDLEFRTEFEFQAGNTSDGSLSSFTAATKTTQKKFSICVRKIKKRVYSDDLFQCIAELNAIEDVADVKTVNELLQFKRYFTLNDVEYAPSSGEASMVMLQKELDEDKAVYILDEPERSLGNEYINDVIVPMIKERARAGKKVFISTHDANIAVRTLPYNSIYRCHEPGGYKTYVGNPFSNSLVNLSDLNDRLDWKTVSMKTLEGGKEAFGERGRIYGDA